jgi:hypothetical protein
MKIIQSTPAEDMAEMRRLRAAQIKANRPSCKNAEEYLRLLKIKRK